MPKFSCRRWLIQHNISAGSRSKLDPDCRARRTGKSTIDGSPCSLERSLFPSSSSFRFFVSSARIAALAPGASPLRTAHCTVLHVPQPLLSSLLLLKAFLASEAFRCALRTARHCMFHGSRFSHCCCRKLFSHHAHRRCALQAARPCMFRSSRLAHCCYRKLLASRAGSGVLLRIVNCRLHGLACCKLTALTCRVLPPRCRELLTGTDMWRLCLLR